MNISSIIKKAIVGLSFILLSSSLFAQNWIWARAGVNDNVIHGLADPWTITADSSGNIFEAGLFTGKPKFGAFTISTVSSSGNAFLIKYDPAGNALWAKNAVSSSSSFSCVLATTVDKTGNSYVTGIYQDTVQFGAYTLTGQHCYNMFLVKYDVAGNVLWAKSSVQPSRYSISNAEAMTTDKEGNVYISGCFQDTITFGAYTLITSTTTFTNLFVVKYSPNGTALWAKKGITMGGCGLDCSNTLPTICSDANDNIYLAGAYRDTLTFGAKVLTNGRAFGNFFLIKFDSSGNVLWGTGGGNGTVPYNYYFTAVASAVDASGNIYVASVFKDSLQIGAYKVASTNNSIFLAKYNSSGTALWAESSSPLISQNFSAYGLSANKLNNVYFSGNYKDSIVFGGGRLVDASLLPSFLMKLDSNGHVICESSTDNYNEDPNAVVADPLADNAYFIGDMDNGTCVFGSDTLSGGTSEWAFMAKWTCGIPEGMNNPVNSNSASLFPNPNKGKFTLQLASGYRLTANSYVVIYNMLGEKVYEQSTTVDNVQINIGTKSPGIYLYRVVNETGEQIANGKFIIE